MIHQEGGVFEKKVIIRILVIVGNFVGMSILGLDGIAFVQLDFSDEKKDGDKEDSYPSEYLQREEEPASTTEG